MVSKTTSGRKPKLSNPITAEAGKPRRVKPPIASIHRDDPARTSHDLPPSQRRKAAGSSPVEVSIMPLSDGQTPDAVRQLHQAQDWLTDRLENELVEESLENYRMIRAAHDLVIESRRSIRWGEPDNRPVKVWAKPETKQLIETVERTIEKLFHQLDKLGLEDACPRHLAAISAITKKLADLMSDDLDQLTHEMDKALQPQQTRPVMRSAAIAATLKPHARKAVKA